MKNLKDDLCLRYLNFDDIYMIVEGSKNIVKNGINSKTPISIEIREEYIENNIEEFGIDLTIDQTKELIDFLQEMLIFLENNEKV